MSSRRPAPRPPVRWVLLSASRLAEAMRAAEMTAGGLLLACATRGHNVVVSLSVALTAKENAYIRADALAVLAEVLDVTPDTLTVRADADPDADERLERNRMGPRRYAALPTSTAGDDAA